MGKFITVHDVEGNKVVLNTRYIFKIIEDREDKDSNSVIHFAVPFKHSGDNNNFYHELLYVVETVQQIMNMIDY